MPSYVANGNIAPSTIVKMVTTAEGKVVACGNTEKPFGIAHEGTRNTPYSGLDDGYAAIAGENLRVYGPGEICWLRIGGTVTVDDRIGSDASGYGVTHTTDNGWVIARALQSGVSGDLIKVEVVPAARY